MSAFDDVLWPLLLLSFCFLFFLHSVDSVMRVGRWEEERSVWMVHPRRPFTSQHCTLFVCSSRKQIYVSKLWNWFWNWFSVRFQTFPPRRPPIVFILPVLQSSLLEGRLWERDIFPDASFYHSNRAPMMLLSGWSQEGGCGWMWVGVIMPLPSTLVFSPSEQEEGLSPSPRCQAGWNRGSPL